jgi:hypothetical protein
LGLDADDFASRAGISVEELKRYEFADTDEISDLSVAEKVGRTLESLESSEVPKIDNGPVPSAHDVANLVYRTLQSDVLGQRLMNSEPTLAADLISTELLAIDPAIRVLGIAERTRGPLRELIIDWDHAGQRHEETVILSAEVLDRPN